MCKRLHSCQRFQHSFQQTVKFRSVEWSGVVAAGLVSTGAGSVSAGVGSVTAGAGSVSSGTGSVSSGTGSVSSGAGSVSSGSGTDVLSALLNSSKEAEVVSELFGCSADGSAVSAQHAVNVKMIAAAVIALRIFFTAAIVFCPPFLCLLFGILSDSFSYYICMRDSCQVFSENIGTAFFVFIAFFTTK